ncbi:hypothetical protein BJ085DRAFT_37875 [Dimargaris cristalligena]|uniref:RGS domain-containing protein n=1 Tax=Dimargaris cristalligena TaxID=215637 RepID=A0A4P9ZWV3_9FUNG|nr:hypothetical protein BJ085DRAFT_37875 [Dimargaris cristalligena]|eukprot:RKP38156.1 hypothetical protein BJ085DRAFT_37875 [Dimargaris cristalligena]
MVSCAIFVGLFYITTTGSFVNHRQTHSNSFLRRRSLTLLLPSALAGGITSTAYFLHLAGDILPCAALFWSLYLGIFTVFFSIFLRGLRLYVLSHVAHQKLPRGLRPACCHPPRSAPAAQLVRQPSGSSQTGAPAVVTSNIIYPRDTRLFPRFLWRWLSRDTHRVDRHLLQTLAGALACWIVVTGLIQRFSTDSITSPWATNCLARWEIYPLAGFSLLFIFVVCPLFIYHLRLFNDVYSIREDLVTIFITGVIFIIPFFLFKVVLPTGLVNPMLAPLFIILHLICIQISSVALPIWKSRTVYRLHGCQLYQNDDHDHFVIKNNILQRALQRSVANTHPQTATNQTHPIILDIDNLRSVESSMIRMSPRSFRFPTTPNPATAATKHTRQGSAATEETFSISEYSQLDKNILHLVLEDSVWFIKLQQYCAENFCAELPLFLADYQMLKGTVLGEVPNPYQDCPTPASTVSSLSMFVLTHYTDDFLPPLGFPETTPPDFNASRLPMGSAHNPHPPTRSAKGKDFDPSPFSLLSLPAQRTPGHSDETVRNRLSTSTQTNLESYIKVINNPRIPPIPTAIWKAYYDRKVAPVSTASIAPCYEPEPRSEPKPAPTSDSAEATGGTTSSNQPAHCEISIESADDYARREIELANFLKENGHRWDLSDYLDVWSGDEKGSSPQGGGDGTAGATGGGGGGGPTQLATQGRPVSLASDEEWNQTALLDPIVPREFFGVFCDFYHKYLVPGAHYEVNVSADATRHTHRIFGAPRHGSTSPLVFYFNVFDEAKEEVCKLISQDVFPNFFLENRAALTTFWENYN